jgi:hypothetical protein
LAQHPVPFATESKYFNTVAFFDYVKKELDLKG